MKFIADFHIHSKYSRATSKNMDVDHIAEWAKLKGIDIVGTGDFTHPMWVEELKKKLKQNSKGLYEYKGIKFILTAEVSNMYSKNGRGRRVHTVLFAPDFETVDKINKTLGSRGNIISDGRPIFGFDVKDIVKICLDASTDSLIVPAHCLLPDSKIHVNHKLKEISDIVEGDKVYTHKTRWRKVKQVYKRNYKGTVVHIKPFYFRCGLQTTPEHPFYALRTVKKCPSTSGFCKPTCADALTCKRKHFRHYKPEWIMAKDLKSSDVLIYPRFMETKDIKEIKISDFVKKQIVKRGKIYPNGTRVKQINNTIQIDEDFCRLAGYYLSEGWTDRRDSIAFCFRSNEHAYIKDVKNLIRKIFAVDTCRTYSRPNVDSVEITFFSKILANFFAKLFYSTHNAKKSFTKQMPYWMLRITASKQVQLFKGWWYGDKGYTSSAVLMNQMKIILLRLGIIPSILIDKTHYRNSKKKRWLGSRYIPAKNDNYQFSNLSFFEDKFNLFKEKEFAKFKTKMKRRHGWIDDKYIYIPIRDINSKKYNGTVYNLEVDRDNSYVAEFATVHNCWTPWFSVFGSKSGFDSIEECFEEEAKNIYALETGLSSDPAMNWRVSALDKYTLISNSDAHSPIKLGREANIFDTEMSYKAIIDALKNKDKKKFLSTVEFFPEEGKYHFDGHRNCNVRFSPKETKAQKGRCPKCGRPLTVGVMNRVDELADRDDNFMPKDAIPFKRLVPLVEIIAEAKQRGPMTKGVLEDYKNAIGHFGNEFKVLLEAEESDLRSSLFENTAEAIIKMRKGDLVIEPGYDGEYGTVKIFKEEELKPVGAKQMELF